MTTTKEHTPVDAAVTDRRRPGRIENVNPALIPLLRSGELPPSVDPVIEDDEPDQLATVRGLFYGAAFSAPLWVGIAYLGRWILS